MKKSIAVIIAMVIVLSLAGCGGGSKDPVQIGTWKMVSMEQSGVSIDMSQLEAQGISGTLTLTADNKASMSVMGQTMEDGTWAAKGDTGVTITFEGESVDATIADGKLTMEQDGAKIVFEKDTSATN